MAGEYSRLVQLAQADDDPQHRQLAMSQIAIISPYVGFHGHSPADIMAERIIDQLYPQATPQDGIAATIARIEAEARARIEEIIEQHRAEALAAARDAATRISAGQSGD